MWKLENFSATSADGLGTVPAIAFQLDFFNSLTIVAANYHIISTRVTKGYCCKFI